MASIRCYTALVATPLNLIVGNQASAIVVLSVVGVVLLACTAAALDFLGGTGRGGAPFVFARLRSSAFVWLGLPAVLVLAIAGAALGAISSGSSEASRGLDIILWCANGAFIVAALICGLCSPLARHWVLALAGFGTGIGALLLFLTMISALGLGDAAGLITHASDRVVFGVAVGGVFLGVALGAASLLALCAYCAERIGWLLHARHDSGAHVGRTAA
ncbi:MAG TPA: hypothetical protein VH916_04730 [Dehalococcoidia bacterium]